MPGFDEWRWAGRLIRQALNPVTVTALAEECSAPDTPGSAAVDARDGVASVYEAKISQTGRRKQDAIARRTRFYWYIVACTVAIGIAAYLSIGAHRIPLWPAALPAAAGVLVFVEAQQFKNRIRDASCLMDLYRDRLRRVRYQWMGKGDPGKRSGNGRPPECG